MNEDFSPYMENAPRYSSINMNQQPIQQPMSQQNTQNAQHPIKKTSNLLSQETVTMIAYAVLTVLILYLIYIYCCDGSEWFTLYSMRSDPAHDATYLEERIELLNDMQDKNLENV